MRIPRYWAKGKPTVELPTVDPKTGKMVKDFSCWGWSDTSVEDAREKGRERADKVAASIRSGKGPQRYPYGATPLREEVVDEWRREDGSLDAAVTINSYGCWVLNSSRVMFVDVDRPEQSAFAELGAALARVFGGKRSDRLERWEAEAIGTLEEWLRSRSQGGVRVYRTKAGLRYLMTHGLEDPTSESSRETMEKLNADPLFVKLCRGQGSYRARLTPKPWRCGMPALRVKYPWAEDGEKRQVEEWKVSYQKKAEGYATCALVGHFGARQVHAEVAPTVGFHDKLTKAESGLKLA